MNRTSILGLFIVLSGVAALLTSTAQSQSSLLKENVALQSANPGFSQSGNANISGAMRAGQFIGDGANLSNLTADLIANGTLSDDRLSGNVAMRGQINSFTAPNYFLSGFVGIGRSTQVTGSEVFGIGNSSPSFAGMYIRTAPQGLPFYGYSLGGNISAYHYVDGSDGGKWKLYQGTGIAMQVDINGRIGLGENPHATARLAVFNQGGAARFSSSGGGFAPTIYSETTGADTLALHGTHASFSGAGGGIRGDSLSPNGVGVVGIVNNTSAGTSYGGFFSANSTQGTGVFGQGTAAGGRFEAISANGTGVLASGLVGLEASSASFGGVGVLGRSLNTNGAANTYGVWGISDNTVFGYGVFSNGRFGASGTKAFRIDHPFDPLNKYLLHYASESPSPQNFYNGNVTTDAKGYAWVELPEYFEEINANFKYQLTVVDDADSDGFILAKVSKEIRGNRFQIRTSEPNVKVSWEIKADRNDLWVRMNGAPDVVEKTGTEKGEYQHPELYGQPAKTPDERLMGPKSELGSKPKK